MTDYPSVDDIYKLFKKTNEQFQNSQVQFDARFAKLEKTVAETNKAVGNLFSCWGHFVEELVEPAAIALFRVQGIDVKETYTRARTRRQGFAMEIDILAIDETELVAIECKSRLTREEE
ncbi:hypothetical protein NIES208_01355 [[Limnothrix rosea] IAM M-220]|nr:hypothetical protein NIES208_01355 [[Limnothrix rosea] IAM M-220]